MMREKIPVNELTIGMFVDGVDKSWLTTPFLKHSFLVRTQDQIEKLRKAGIKDVYIDPLRADKGLINFQETVDSNKVSNTLSDDTPSTPGNQQKVDFQRYVTIKESLFEVDRQILREGSTVNFSIIRKKGMDIEPIFTYEDKDVEIDRNILDAKNELLINRKDILKYKYYIKQLHNIASAESFDPKFYGAIIKENTKLVIKEVFDNPKSKEALKKGSDAVSEIINAILGKSVTAASLLSVNKFDYYLYTHSVNVCVLSLCVAILFGITDETELHSISLGALLHDIGKSTISPEIINKPFPRLTEIEQMIYKRHVLESVSLVRLFSDVKEEVVYPILQHHEKLSGRGYPNGIRETEFHLFGKIVSLVNYYDNITTDWPQRKAKEPFEALAMLKEQIDHYDVHVLNRLIRMLGRS